jgi:DNA-binding transcriptional regulator YiaG
MGVMRVTTLGFVNEAHAIGDRLREARKRRGLTQRELARESGVSLSLVSRDPGNEDVAAAWRR